MTSGGNSDPLFCFAFGFFLLII